MRAAGRLGVRADVRAVSRLGVPAGVRKCAHVSARLFAPVVAFAGMLAAAFALVLAAAFVSAAVVDVMPGVAGASAISGSSISPISVAWAAESKSNQKMPEDTITDEILDVALADLEAADEYLNGQTVQVVGEVVGDRINAEWSNDHYWLTLEARDDSHAEVSVYVDEDMTELVDTYGVYGKTGTVLQIAGTFNLACDEHEGLSDLHADEVEVVSEGEEVAEEPNMMLLIPAVILVAVGLILVFVFYRMREGLR